MSSLWAVWGELRVPERLELRARALDGALASGWQGLGGPVPLPASVGALLDELAGGIGAATSFSLAVKKRSVAVEALLDRDAFLEHARRLGALFRAAPGTGASGVLFFVVLDGAPAGYRIEAADGVVVALDDAALGDARVARALATFRARLEAVAREHEAPAAAPKKAAPQRASPRKGSPARVAAPAVDAGALAATVADADAALKARAAALRALATLDAASAVELARPFLADDALEQRRLFALSDAALDVLCEHDGEPLVRRLVEILLGRRQSGYDRWARGGLERARWPGTAALIAATLTAETFARSTGALELLDVLRARREVGDRAHLEALASDPWSLFSGAALPDALLVRVTEAAADVLAAAR